MNKYVYEKVARLDFDDSCNIPDYHSVVTIQLCELANDGFFDLTRSDWDFGPKYSERQHTELCRKITEHYWFREIGLVPPGIWKHEFLRKMNEIMPKYMAWYEVVETRAKELGRSYDYIYGDGNKNVTGRSNETGTTSSDENSRTVEQLNLKDDEYYKGRNIFSDFPQTSLAGRNQDYASTGNDGEYERIDEHTGSRTTSGERHGTGSSNKTGTSNSDEKRDYRETREHVADPLNLMDNILTFNNVDAAIIDEIESLFSSLFTVNINAW